MEQPRLDDLAIVFIQQGLPGGAALFFLLGLVVELLQIFLGGGIVDLQVVIGVIRPHRRHGQNLAGVDVHHDAERAVLHIVLRNGSLHVLLKIILHRRVDRRNQAAAVGRLIVFFVGVEHFRLVVALCRDDSPGITLEGIVVVGFQALGADVFCIGKAQDLRRQRGVRVGTFGVRLQVHAPELIVTHIGPDLIGQVLRDLPFDDLIAHLRIGGLLDDIGLFKVQDLPQILGQLVEIHFVLTQLQRVQEDVFHRGGGGQHIHISVVDRPPVGADGRAAGLVRDGLALIDIMLRDHHVKQRDNQGDKQKNATHCHNAKCAAQEEPVRSRVFLSRSEIPFSFSGFFACHRRSPSLRGVPRRKLQRGTDCQRSHHSPAHSSGCALSNCMSRSAEVFYHLFRRPSDGLPGSLQNVLLLRRHNLRLILAREIQFDGLLAVRLMHPQLGRLGFDGVEVYFFVIGRLQAVIFLLQGRDLVLQLADFVRRFI